MEQLDYVYIAAARTSWPNDRVLVREQHVGRDTLQNDLPECILCGPGDMTQDDYQADDWIILTASGAMARVMNLDPLLMTDAVNSLKALCYGVLNLRIDVINALAVNGMTVRENEVAKKLKRDLEGFLDGVREARNRER